MHASTNTLMTLYAIIIIYNIVINYTQLVIRCSTCYCILTNNVFIIYIILYISAHHYNNISMFNIRSPPYDNEINKYCN